MSFSVQWSQKKNLYKNNQMVYMWSIPILKEFQAMKRTNIYLSEIQAKKLKVIGKKLGLGVSEIIRRMIDEALKKYEAKARK